MSNLYLTSLIFPFYYSPFVFDKNSSNWEEIHNEILTNNHQHVSLDKIPVVWETVWSDFKKQDIILIKSIEKTSNAFLTIHGNDIILRNNNSYVDNDIQTAWTMLIRSIDPTILLSWLWREKEVSICPKSISVNNAALKKLFKSGLNEYHLHYGAIGSLDYFLRAIFPNKSMLDKLLISKKIGPKTWVKNSCFGTNFINPYLISTVHGILAWQVYNFHMYIENQSFKLPKHNLFLQKAKEYWKKLEELILINSEENFDFDTKNIQSRISSILEPIIEKGIKDDVFTNNIFLSKSFKIYYLLYSKQRGQIFKIYAYYLKKMLWLRNCLYTFFIHRQERPGLSYFKHYYDKIEFTENKTLDLKYKIRSLYPTTNYKINYLELRFGINHFISNYKYFLKQYSSLYNWSINKNYNGDNYPKICFIISLNKVELSNVFGNGVRYSQYINEQLIKINHSLEILRSNPKLLYLFRGFDVCNFEKALPNWIFTNLFMYIKDRSQELFYGISKDTPSIRFTFQAGEDFHSPISGLRNIYEAVRWGNIKDNNRIGHGLALGIDIDDWFKRERVYDNTLSVPVGILLDDLIFELLLIHEGFGDKGDKLKGDENKVIKNINSIIEFIRNNISYKYDLKLFNTKIENLLFSYKYRFDYKRLKDNQRELNPNNLNLIHNSEWFIFQDVQKLKTLSIIEELFYEYLTCEELFKVEKKPYFLNNLIEDNYIERAKNIQEFMLNNLNDISIETCPSSNIFISRTSDFKKHPIFKIFPINKDKKVNVSINSDDPLIFNTNIFNEYQNIFIAAKNKYSRSPDVNVQNITDWLSEINSKSVDYSFYVEKCQSNIYELCKDEGIFYMD